MLAELIEVTDSFILKTTSFPSKAQRWDNLLLKIKQWSVSDVRNTNFFSGKHWYMTSMTPSSSEMFMTLNR